MRVKINLLKYITETINPLLKEKKGPEIRGLFYYTKLF